MARPTFKDWLDIYMTIDSVRTNTVRREAAKSTIEANESKLTDAEIQRGIQADTAEALRRQKQTDTAPKGEVVAPGDYPSGGVSNMPTTVPSERALNPIGVEAAKSIRQSNVNLSLDGALKDQQLKTAKFELRKATIDQNYRETFNQVRTAESLLAAGDQKAGMDAYLKAYDTVNDGFTIRSKDFKKGTMMVERIDGKVQEIPIPSVDQLRSMAKKYSDPSEFAKLSVETAVAAVEFNKVALANAVESVTKDGKRALTATLMVPDQTDVKETVIIDPDTGDIITPEQYKKLGYETVAERAAKLSAEKTKQETETLKSKGVLQAEQAKKAAAEATVLETEGKKKRYVINGKTYREEDYKIIGNAKKDLMEKYGVDLEDSQAAYYLELQRADPNFLTKAKTKAAKSLANEEKIRKYLEENYGLGFLMDDI